MKLKDFLSVLTSTNIQITLKDLTTGSEIASMKASGYESLDDAVESREVMQWSITSATAITIVLGDAVEP